MLEFFTDPRVIVGTIVYLGIGVYLFFTVFVMGLIGFTDKGGKLFIFMYTVGCFFAWPGYLAWFFIPNIDWKEVFSFRRKSMTAYYTCEGKGGKYELIQIATDDPGLFIGISTHLYFGNSTGAGTCKGEELKLFEARADKVVEYIGTELVGTVRYIYRDVETKKYYHRTPADFRRRMKRI